MPWYFWMLSIVKDRNQYKYIIQTNTWLKCLRPFCLLAIFLFFCRDLCVYISDAISWFQRPNTKWFLSNSHPDKYRISIGSLYLYRAGFGPFFLGNPTPKKEKATPQCIISAATATFKEITMNLSILGSYIRLSCTLIKWNL